MSVACLVPSFLVEVFPDTHERSYGYRFAAIAELRDAVGAQELDGVLELDGLDRAELLVYKAHGWEREVAAPFIAKHPERQPQFTTGSGAPVQRLYTSADVDSVN